MIRPKVSQIISYGFWVEGCTAESDGLAAESDGLAAHRSGVVSPKQEDWQSPSREYGRIRGFETLEAWIHCLTAVWGIGIGL